MIIYIYIYIYTSFIQLIHSFVFFHNNNYSQRENVNGRSGGRGGRGV